MAVRQINTADYDYAMFLETLNKSYKGKSNITISEYDSDAAPDVKVGSVWEDNGAIFILETADLEPTGYAGISNSTTFFLYYDESAKVFIYSETVPTWSDVLQDWYNSNDRAFFFMYKDSGGTLYQSKQLLKKQGELYTKVIEIGDWNMDGTGFVDVVHNLTLTKIRMVSVLIINDAETISYNLINSVSGTVDLYRGGWFDIDAANVTLNRSTNGFFDDTDFNATSFNRGWVTITYEA